MSLQTTAANSYREDGADVTWPLRWFVPDSGRGDRESSIADSRQPCTTDD